MYTHYEDSSALHCDVCGEPKSRDGQDLVCLPCKDKPENGPCQDCEHEFEAHNPYCRVVMPRYDCYCDKYIGGSDVR